MIPGHADINGDSVMDTYMVIQHWPDSFNTYINLLGVVCEQTDISWGYAA